MTQLIDRKRIKPHPHNKMWGKSDAAHKSLGMTISVTKDVEPIRVCKTSESDNHYLIVSGHSRFELSSGPTIECKDLGVLTEEQQMLRLIAYNAGHSTHPGKLVAAASYCHKTFSSISIDSIMDAAGIVDNRAEWQEALELSINAIEGASTKNRKRTGDSVVAAAEKGPKAIKETASRSLSKIGTRVAAEPKSSVEENASKSLANNSLTAENTPNPTEDFKEPSPVPAIQKTDLSTGGEAGVKTLRKKLMEEYKLLIRKHNGAIPDGPAREASSFLIQFLEGKTPEKSSQLSTAILESQIAKEKDEHQASVSAVDAAIVMINGVFKKHMANVRNGEVFVPAYAISEAMRINGFESVNDMNPEVLASRIG